MKLFIILPRVPYPLEKGDKLRAFYQIEQLSKHHDIYLCALNDQAIHPEAIDKLSPFCKEIHIFNLSKTQIIINITKAFFLKKPFQIGYYHSNKIQKQIDALISKIKPDHIYCQLVRASEYVKNQPTPKTLDYQDAFSKGIERRINKSGWPLNLIFKLEYNRLRAYERDIFNFFNNKTIISEKDRENIDHPNKEQIHIIRNGVSLEKYSKLERSKDYTLVFTGNMSYAPNIDCAEYIINKVLPLVINKIPNLKVMIAGANPHKRVSSLASDIVNVTGWVDDMRECYARSFIFLAPMQIGIGLQNKLLEAMAMELPCITSPLANSSLGATNGEHILVGSNAQECAQHILDLISNKELYNKISKNGHQFIAEHYKWDSVTDELNQIIINTPNKG